MTNIEKLARELAARDVREGLAPIASIEEMKTVLARELFEVYEAVYPEVEAVVRTLTDERCTCAVFVCKVHGQT